jgi:hypothetical protein
MTPQGIEKLIWVLIYGGLLVVCLGFFVQRQSAALGWTLAGVGAAAAVVGAVLVWVRSRMKT